MSVRGLSPRLAPGAEFAQIKCVEGLRGAQGKTPNVQSDWNDATEPMA
jgi:hypothetical protein